MESEWREIETENRLKSVSKSFLVEFLIFRNLFGFAYFNVLLMKTINEIVAGIINARWIIDHQTTCVVSFVVWINGCVIMTVLNVSQKLLLVGRLRRGSAVLEIMSLVMYRNVIDQGIVMKRSNCGCCWCGIGCRRVLGANI